MSKILYIEDEPLLAKIVIDVLTDQHYTVVHSTNGAEAFALYCSEHPDLCLLDIMLPHKDGFTIGEEIRAVNKQVPIIFLTAKTQTEDLITGFKKGGNDYIKKPFKMEELMVRIENLLRISGNQIKETDYQLTIGSYSFHYNHQTLQFNDQIKKLSFRENELLKFLIAQRYKIVDRRDILNLLWGNDSFYNSRTLDVYITKLRSYLKEDSSIEILTVKGVGYKFLIH